MLWSIRRRRRLELLEKRQLACSVRAATGRTDRSRRDGWMRGVATVRRGSLQFEPMDSVVVPGPSAFTIQVEQVLMLDPEPEPWTIPELVGIDTKQIMLLIGADGRFHLRLERRDVERTCRELLGESKA